MGWLVGLFVILAAQKNYFLLVACYYLGVE
jgi:hypothetical protein